MKLATRMPLAKRKSSSSLHQPFFVCACTTFSSNMLDAEMALPAWMPNE
jgi:hypothetical protein